MIYKAIIRLGSSVFVQSYFDGHVIYAGVSDAIRRELEAKVAAGDFTIEEIKTEVPVIELPKWTEFNLEMLADLDFQSWQVPGDVRISLIAAATIGKEDAFQSAITTALALAPLDAAVLERWQARADKYLIPVRFN